MNTMNILITGASGFIGSRLADALLSRGNDKIFLAGRSEEKHRSLIARGAVFFAGDLTSEKFCSESCRNIDAVIHCAGLAGTWGPYSTYFDANVRATRNLLAGAKLHGVKRFVNISSPSIYFDYKDQFDLREDFRPAKFSNHYASTKWEAEQLVQSAHGGGLLTVSLRPRSVIGAGDRNVLPRLLRLQQEGKLVQIGSGQTVIDVTSVSNLIDAITLCLTAPISAMGTTYNITNGEPLKAWDFVDSVLRAANLPTEHKRLPFAPVMALARLNEIFHRLIRSRKEPSFLPIAVGVATYSMTLNIDKAREKLGYKPRVSTQESVEEFVRDWQKTSA